MELLFLLFLFSPYATTSQPSPAFLLYRSGQYHYSTYH